MVVVWSGRRRRRSIPLNRFHGLKRSSAQAFTRTGEYAIAYARGHLRNHRARTTRGTAPRGRDRSSSVARGSDTPAFAAPASGGNRRAGLSRSGTRDDVGHVRGDAHPAALPVGRKESAARPTLARRMCTREVPLSVRESTTMATPIRHLPAWVADAAPRPGRLPEQDERPGSAPGGPWAPGAYTAATRRLTAGRAASGHRIGRLRAVTAREVERRRRLRCGPMPQWARERETNPDGWTSTPDRSVER